MLILYRIILYIAFPVVIARLLYRAIRNNRYFARIPQRFGFKLTLPQRKPGDGSANRLRNGSMNALGDKPENNTPRLRCARIWIHAVSVGEVNATVPLIKKLKETYPDAEIIVTTMTPTGSDRVSKILADEVQHCYLPYDYPGAVKRFLNKACPDLAIVMETEIWPNFIDECQKREIPMIYTNVRLSPRSHRGYRRFRKLIEPTLKKVTQFAVQSTADAERLIDLGAHVDKVMVTGSIKFEIDIPASLAEAAQSVRRDLGWDRPVWVAGSTREGEENQILDAFLKAKKEKSDLLLILVPRHPERFNSVHRLCNQYPLNAILRSQVNTKIPDNTEVYIVDSMGELPLFIASGDIAYIGGSLVPTGGHNLLEACASGIVVVFGPHMFNFQDISDMVLAKGAGIQVMDADELADVIVRLINDPVLRDQYGIAGKKLVDENKGALAKIYTIIEKYC